MTCSSNNAIENGVKKINQSSFPPPLSFTDCVCPHFIWCGTLNNVEGDGTGRVDTAAGFSRIFIMGRISVLCSKENLFKTEAWTVLQIKHLSHTEPTQRIRQPLSNMEQGDDPRSSSLDHSKDNTWGVGKRREEKRRGWSRQRPTPTKLNGFTHPLG